MVNIMEKGIECSDCAGAVKAVFGVADLASSTVSLYLLVWTANGRMDMKINILRQAIDWVMAA